MSKKAYRVDWRNRITEYEAQRWSEKSVWVVLPDGVVRHSIRGQYAQFYRSRSDAVQYVLQRLQLDVDRAKIALNSARSRLGQFKAEEKLK